MLAMTPTEYEGWWQHIARFPPVEQILASLALTVAKALGASDAKPGDYGFWLESPEMRRAREEREKTERRIREARLTADAYRRSKEQADG